MMSNASLKIYVVFIFVLFFGPSDAITAQNEAQNLCGSIFDAVASSMRPEHIYRRHVFEKSCDYEFVTDNDSKILVSIEQYENERESRKAFIEDSKDFYGNLRQRKRVSSVSVKYWDDIGFFVSKPRHNTYLLLRRKRIMVTVFSDNVQTLFRIEKLLRTSSVLASTGEE